MLMLKLDRKTLSMILILFITQNLFSLQFGNGNNESSTTFIKVADDVKDFTFDMYTTYILKNDNSLWGTGYFVYEDFYNEGSEINSFIKVQEDVLSFSGRLLKKTDGTTYKVYKGLNQVNSNIKKMAGAFYITDDNTLWVEGENSNGSFGTGYDEIDYDRPVKVRVNVKDVYYSRLYSLIITNKNELMISGSHYLPYPYKKNNKFEKIADNVRYTIDNFYITDKDELYVFGWAAHGITGLGDLGDKWKLLPTKVMDDVKSVACNGQATLILKNDGTLYGCGGGSPNYCGELGLGNYKTIYTPQYIMSDVIKIDMGSTFSGVLKSDGTFWMCGSNNEWEGTL